jgi:hypothetical protein
MTAQNLIELVLEESPLENPAIAELYLDNALREFCDRTGILRARTTFSTSNSSLRPTLTDFPTDIVRIRSIDKQGIELVNTNQGSYLRQDNGFWYIESNNPIQLYLGFWNGSADQAFDSGETFNIIYERYARKFATDSNGDEDYQQEPEIPTRFHECLVHRACERAFKLVPEVRTYHHALWKDQVKEGRKYANANNTDAKYNVKIYEL